MVNRFLSNNYKLYIETEAILTELKQYDEEALKPIKEYNEKKLESIIQNIYQETERLGGDKPQKQVNYWTEEPTRVLVHRILVKARELDFADVSYEDYVDKDSLVTVLQQLDHCCKHKKELKS